MFSVIRNEQIVHTVLLLMKSDAKSDTNAGRQARCGPVAWPYTTRFDYYEYEMSKFGTRVLS